MEIPHKESKLYPEILIDINRINVKNHEVYFYEEEWFSSDLILFDSNQAKQLIKQYTQFEINFDKINFFKEIQKERERHIQILNRESNNNLVSQKGKWESTEGSNWIANYFFPLNVSKLIRGIAFVT
jgi:hypothetical protein